MQSVASLVVFLALTYGAAFVGTLFTVGAIETWYATLTKPELSPPNWLFGPVWTVLYALMAIAAWIVYQKRRGDQKTKQLLWVYGAHLAVNAFWSVAFFGLQNPALAFIVIIVLWLMIAYLLRGFYRIDRAAGLLLLPYLGWVSFASYLNLSIIVLN